ncbi:MAG TPA: hypothetical protein VLA51_11470, partial [Paracoccaceae bacterium]|nr:hypothetical protein [Paracoccaceae bacterium]
MRKSFICLSLILMCAGPGVSETKRIVFIAGVASHGYGEHAHEAGARLLAKCLNESGLDVRADVCAGWPTDAAVLANADAVAI